MSELKPGPVSGLAKVGERQQRSYAESTTPHEPFDFEKELDTYIKQMEEENIKTRSLGVVFENLRMVGRAHQQVLLAD
ncbi:hypothetical protein CPB83DRAFT_892050 [Crepidotus variabilis]|uniref:Pleiotropic ABC efflux transporter N-terminal domain-containing protein n=1 Tax=Crepidotus variabilis TaxID=179855 RepID=A0A9P6ELP4_9AGAR|nr:hypothetical protein CPB83DRAFT_892050 [Crepidotus variabilis]